MSDALTKAHVQSPSTGAGSPLKPPLTTMILAAGIAPRPGGAESLAENLCLAAMAQGDPVHLLCGNEPETRLRGELNNAGGSCTVVSNESHATRRRSWSYDSFYRAEHIFESILDVEPDVVFCLSHDAALSTHIALQGPIAKRPLIITLFSEMAGARDVGFGQCRLKLAYGLPTIDLHVCLSARYESIARDFGAPPNKTVKLPIGLDQGLYRASAEKTRASNRGTRTIICHSRFIPRKGQDILIQAFARFLNRADGPWRLLLAGDLNNGSSVYIDALATLVRRYGIERAVEMRTVHQSEVPVVLGSAAISVQPSRFEGLGYSALESMAAGVPCIVTDTEGFNEYAVNGENCLTVPVGSVDALAAALLRLSADTRLARRLVEAAHRTVDNSFDLHHSYAALRRMMVARCRGAADGCE